MAKPVDMELKKAFTELQVKMVETSKKIQIIDSQINTLKRVLQHLDITQREISTLPPGTKTYESIGRIFLHTDLDEVQNNLKTRVSQLTKRTTDLDNNKQYLVQNNLKTRVSQLTKRTTDLDNNKQYLEKNHKESEDNILEMVQQRKEQSDAKAN